MKNRPNADIILSKENYVEGLGYEVDLDESTCTPETLAYLSAPDNEQAMPLEEWKELYAERVKDGYYEKLKQNEIPDSELPF